MIGAQGRELGGGNLLFAQPSVFGAQSAELLGLQPSHLEFGAQQSCLMPL